MRLFFNDKTLDNTVREIRLRLKTSMNGEVSESMQKRGADYHIIYGVEYPRLKGIAQNYIPNTDLAYRLWSINIRETMILGTLLQPIDTFTILDAHKWMKNINQMEQVEYLCLNLFSKVSFAKELVSKWIENGEEWYQIVAYTTATRIANQLNNEQITQLLTHIKTQSKTTNYLLYKSMALVLTRLCRHNPLAIHPIQQLISTFEQTTHTAERYIYSEVMAELSFL